MALFTLGSHVLPTLTFDVVEPQGGGVARIDGPDIEARSSLPKNADQLGAKLEDIKPNEDVPVRSWRLLRWLLGLAAVAALAWFARRAWLRRPRRLASATPPPPLEERTRAALDALESEGLPERGLQREFHFRLNGLVRGYLGERFGFDALECTSGELLREVEHRALPGVDQAALQRFVDQCDVARYARGDVPVPACASALGFARGLVEATRPRLQPGPPTPPGPIGPPGAAAEASPGDVLRLEESGGVLAPPARARGRGLVVVDRPAPRGALCATRWRGCSPPEGPGCGASCAGRSPCSGWRRWRWRWWRSPDPRRWARGSATSRSRASTS